jgi:ribosomal protein S18 acetylase RimI-like enzyme
MNLRDWREAAAVELAPLYEAERLKWRRHLRWDTAASWREVELARTTWGLPGFLAVDARGRVRGAVFFMFDDGRLDIGGLTSDCVEATDALIDGVMCAARAGQVRSARALLFDGAVALRSGLESRGFVAEPHLYLSRTFRGQDRPAAGRAARRPAATGTTAMATAPRTSLAFDTWRPSDVAPAAALLSRAYDRKAAALFAPDHSAEAWEQYMRNLTTYTACGTLNAAATRLVREGERLTALGLITDISEATAHVAQLAVDPDLRGQGIGGALLAAIVAGLTAQKYDALTLIVAHDNYAARALYDASGFRHEATFIAASVTFAARDPEGPVRTWGQAAR